MSVKSRFYELIDAGLRGSNQGLSLGLPKLEMYVDGYLPGTSYLIAAQSGVGKSTFMLYTLVFRPLIDYLTNDYEVDRDPCWIMFNLEMTPEQIYAKLISMYIYETFGEQMTYKEMFSRGKGEKLSKDRYEMIKQCDEFLDILDKRIIFHDGTLTADKYYKYVLNDLKLFGTFNEDTYTPNNPNQIIGIIIDHLSLVRASAGKSKKDEMDLISAYSVGFRNKCKIVSPIHIMQFNRNANGQERIKQGLQEPDSSDFKDSAAMYEDSQVVIALHSPIKFKFTKYRKYNIAALAQNFVACILLKTRFGTSDIAVGLGFYGDCSTYKELPKGEEITDYEIYKTPNWSLLDYKQQEDAIDNTEMSSSKMTLTL